jgi:hypothetical protein
MYATIASRIMARTTLNIDDPILADLKRLQQKEAKPLGDLVSELLASAIAARKTANAPAPRLHWTASPMGALVDISDKDALFAVMDRIGRKQHPQP